jgi:2-oxoglutarate ferredoxin oxidoreductase subunit alpha
VSDGEISVLIGGKAGEGISSAGQVIAHLLARQGYHIHMYFDYPSLIKGGHNFAIIRGAHRPVGAVREQVDFILALDHDTVKLHQPRLDAAGVIIRNTDTVKIHGGIGIGVREILDTEQAPAVMGNSAIIGAFVKAAGIDWTSASEVLRKSYPKGTEQNLRVARRGYEQSEPGIKVVFPGGRQFPVFSGNEAIGIGLVEAGLGLYIGYPMSPTSNLLHFLAASAGDAGIRVIQPESEIAVILMALGSAYAGTRAAVGTSGGGFCLMTEALGLSGIAELPVVIVLGQRTGPSTGLATYTAQSDLQFAIGAGQGDFPRLVVAPGNAQEARKWANAGMNLAWKYQIPVILLSDKILCEGLYTLDPADTCACDISPVSGESGIHPYLRYAFSDSGISPMRFPPMKGDVVRVNSHVHDPEGITTEDIRVTRAMADKRAKKMQGLKEELEGMDTVPVGGDTGAETALLCWGSNKGICRELGEKMGLRVVQPVGLWPFPERTFAAAMEGVERFYAVETNESGQLARLVRQFGYVPDGLILKYDGRPFTVEELESEIRKVIS